METNPTINVKYAVRVLRPFGRYLEHLIQHEISDSALSDLIVNFEEAATAAYHFPEVENCIGSLASDTVKLRSDMADVVDSRKHGKLRNPGRIVTLRSALMLEVDSERRSAMLGTAIYGKSVKLGDFDADMLLQNYLKALARDLGLPPPPEAIRETGPFQELLMLMSSGSPQHSTVDLRTFARIDSNLVPVSIPFRFEFVEKPGGGLVFSFTCSSDLIEADPEKPITPIPGCNVHAFAIVEIVQRPHHVLE